MERRGPLLVLRFAKRCQKFKECAKNDIPTVFERVLCIPYKAMSTVMQAGSTTFRDRQRHKTGAPRRNSGKISTDESRKSDGLAGVVLRGNEDINV